MKFRWDKKYLYWGVTAAIVLAVAVLFNFLLQNNLAIKQSVAKLWKISAPITYGLVIAFLINPLVKWFETSVFPVFDKKVVDYRLLPSWKRNLVRSLSLLFSYIVLLLILACFAISVFPQIKDSIVNIAKLFPTYKENFFNWIDNLTLKYPEISKNFQSIIEENEEYFNNWTNNTFVPKLEELAGNASLYVYNVFSAVKNILIGIIVSMYVLFKKETFKGQFKKIFYSLFGIKNTNVILKNVRMANSKFSGFIIGKIVDSLIIGVICFIGCSILKIEYPVLIAMIIGVTNIIPFFGPIIGAIPCVLLLLLINPIHALYFVIFVIILQALDGNVIGPKILGSSTGISSFWVIFAITIFGGFWGVPGMIIGVPLFAVIYALVQSSLEISLKQKEISSSTSDFVYLDHIDNETKEFVEKELLSETFAKKKAEKDRIKAEKKAKKESKNPEKNNK